MSKGPTQSEKLDKLLWIMQGRKQHSKNTVEWKHRYLIVSDEREGRSIYRVRKNNLVTRVIVDGIVTDILQYLDVHPILSMDYDGARRVAKTYIRLAECSPLPPLTREHGSTELAFHEFPYPFQDVTDAELETKAPLFHDMLARIPVNKSAFVEFIGSTTLNDVDIQQFMLMKGSGIDGKGTMINLIADLHGPAFTAGDETLILTSHGTTCIENKRICGFGDVHDPSFLEHGKFKSITGGDPFTINPKGEPMRTIRSRCQVIAATNREHALSGHKSDMRRLIYIEFVDSPAEVNPRYRELINLEAPGIFGYCRRKYLEANPDRGQIQTEKKAFDQLLEETHEEYELFLEQYCRMIGDCRPVEMRGLFKAHIARGNTPWGNFKSYLKNYRGVRMQNNGNGSSRKMRGVSIKGTTLVPRPGENDVFR